MGMNLSVIDLGFGVSVKQVVAGGRHTCALLSTGELKCWGKNNHGQLGAGDTFHRGDEEGEMGMNLSAVPLGTHLSLNQLAAGQEYTCALLSNNELKCWGNNDRGQLGQGDRFDRGGRPGDIASLTAIDLGTDESGQALNVKQTVTGGEHACVLFSDGRVKCWGSNEHGQLGLGDTNHRGDAVKEMGNDLAVVDLGAGLRAKQITAGQRHTCVLLTHGQVKCWGENVPGQEGHRGDDAGEMGDDLAVIDFGTDGKGPALTVKQITSGGSSSRTCAILSDDTMRCWGRQ